MLHNNKTWAMKKEINWYWAISSKRNRISSMMRTNNSLKSIIRQVNIRWSRIRNRRFLLLLRLPASWSKPRDGSSQRTWLGREQLYHHQRPAGLSWWKIIWTIHRGRFHRIRSCRFRNRHTWRFQRLAFKIQYRKMKLQAGVFHWHPTISQN